MATQKWNDLPRGARRLILVAAVVQFALLGAAHADLSRRSELELRGPKGLWRALTLVNFVGPIAYFTVGRRR